jgi:DNA-binding LacI/PurR family transcriptional regulator
MPKGRWTAEPRVPKYRQVFEKISRDIRVGKFQPGQRLPSEAALVQQFGTSRITIGRALRELKERGRVERVAGSGTFVPAGSRAADGLLFGLLIPDLGETEIFEPICQGMAGAPQTTPHALLWGQTDRATKEQQALHLCHQYLARKVSGVFFAPLECTPAKDEVNRQIAALFEKARIPVVLLDRCFLPFPRRSRHDLVGIDNRRAAYLGTEHLLKAGCKRVAFLGLSGAAPTVDARIAGYREALLAYDAPLEPRLLQRPDSLAVPDVRRVMAATHANAFVCANDHTAGQFMHGLQELSYRIPHDVRIVGMDDVEYASLLPVPLTTIHQPCREIGEAAIAAMLDRIARPGMLTRDILLEAELVVRKSASESVTR